MLSRPAGSALVTCAPRSGKMALEAGDMEDGQLSDSDSDMTVAPSDRPPQVQKVLDEDSAVRAFQNTAATTHVPVSHYRIVKSVDSSEESFSDSDDDSSLWKPKRQKCLNPPPKPEPFQFGQSSQKPPVVGGKKVNNIWGAVLQEQNQDAVATELGILGMEGNIDKSRQSETYNYLLAKKLKRESEEFTKELDKELDDYMHSDKKPGSKEEENGQGHLKRKRPVRDRLGDRLEMNYKGRYEITEEDSQEKVADEISFRLQEPKKDLIARVVRIIGNKKAIELLMETAEVEQNGGLFIMNGSRRRTPGGVFLNLLKNTPSISEEQIKAWWHTPVIPALGRLRHEDCHELEASLGYTDIFYIENQKEYENKKAARKRRTQILGKKMKQAIKSLNFQEDDDTSRETFASDTNEALASLDEPQEGHGETKLDVEEAIEVDHSHDLDIF
ncbi:phosphorylated adapter RNA export protein isoform X1 [Heterocephalus glaber]|uniref:Phosphorylated adapter RNA export protein n=1 Tax=Heterocephalus glaber TaxID=10181 RepID=A0AAX6TMC4_HETGA|nr:phosphorylated adapter RNA export protein isoform X1 [Heterocephalus glaber]